MQKLLFCALFACSFNAAAQRPIEIPKGYQIISERYQVPVNILFGVALNESMTPTTGNRIFPWPWSANVEGKSYRFNTREELYQFAKELIATGTTSIDLCASQINWKWNGHRFKSLADAIDPATCLETSAVILKSLYQNTNDWVEAAGLYHNPSDSKKAAAYKARLRHKLDLISGKKPFTFPKANRAYSSKQVTFATSATTTSDKLQPQIHDNEEREKKRIILIQ
ncbi:hypothetical protein D3C80_121600 [compost metagenome]